jgi:hypothetical protein
MGPEGREERMLKVVRLDEDEEENHGCCMAWYAGRRSFGLNLSNLWSRSRDSLDANGKRSWRLAGPEKIVFLDESVCVVLLV